MLQAEQLAIERLRQLAAGRANRPYNSAGMKQFLLIEETLEDHGVPDEELRAKITAFLDSKAYKDFPANRISALAWAAIDQAVAGGQKNHLKRPFAVFPPVTAYSMS